MLITIEIFYKQIRINSTDSSKDIFFRDHKHYRNVILNSSALNTVDKHFICYEQQIKYTIWM